MTGRAPTWLVAEVRPSNGLVARQLIARALEGDAPDLEHVRASGRPQREARVLLDDEDAQALLLVPPHVGAEPEVLLDRQLREDAATFRHVRDAEPHDALGRRARDRPALEGDRARVADETRDGAERRRLAGTVRAENCDDLAFVHGQRDAVQ